MGGLGASLGRSAIPFPHMHRGPLLLPLHLLPHLHQLPLPMPAPPTLVLLLRSFSPSLSAAQSQIATLYKQANGLKYHMTHGSCNFATPRCDNNNAAQRPHASLIWCSHM